MPIRVALIGTGKIAVANHIPGIGFCRDAEVVAVDADLLPVDVKDGETCVACLSPTRRQRHQEHDAG